MSLNVCSLFGFEDTNFKDTYTTWLRLQYCCTTAFCIGFTDCNHKPQDPFSYTFLDPILINQGKVNIFLQLLYVCKPRTSCLWRYLLHIT